MADLNQFDDQRSQRPIDPVKDGYANPLEPQVLAGDERDSPARWVPVSADDHQRRRRNIKLAIAVATLVFIALAAWAYKRQVDPVRALEAFDAGERELRSARYPQALVSFDRAIALRPDYADAYLMRARTQVARGHLREALPDFEQAILRRPSDPAARLERGQAFADLREYPAAIADFTAAIELSPNLPAAYTRRGVVFRTVGRYAESIQDLTRAIELREDVESLIQRAATYQALDQHARAIEDLTRVIAYEPNSPQPYFARSLSRRALGDDAGAAADHATGRRLDYGE